MPSSSLHVVRPPKALPMSGSQFESLRQAAAEAFSAANIAKRAAASTGAGTGTTEPVRGHSESTYLNRLILSASPYLQQHARNPVDWFPWGDEAFSLARELDRPILLSVGYATCHWCHVMERESFENQIIAHIINENYVPIKVDREERPDVDGIYMTAVQAMTGHGGWPMTVWLLPDGRPFHGGTYYPAFDGDRGIRHGFASLLKGLASAYRSQKPQVLNTAQQLEELLLKSATGDVSAEGSSMESAVRNVALTKSSEEELDAALEVAANFYKESYDESYGGLRGAPKFPSSWPSAFLLRYGDHKNDARLLAMVHGTLVAIASGGLRDHIGGGFHRYSVDAEWLVPHFEKMLYDNASLIVSYIEGWQTTNDPKQKLMFREVAEETLDYLLREMVSQEGLFFAATDADSLGEHGEPEEGAFFTWTPGEVISVLDDTAGRDFCEFYHIEPDGHLDGRSIPHLNLGTASKPRPEFPTKLKNLKNKLYEARQERPRPLLDDKVVTAWNGLAISAFAKAGFAFNSPTYTESATRAAEVFIKRFQATSQIAPHL